MARSKIIFPKHDALFQTVIQVRITDINYGNHLGNDSMLSILHEARMQFLAAHQMSEMDVKGAGLILAEALILYKGQAYFGDRLQVKIWADDLTNVSFDMLYEVTATSAENTLLVAQAKTTMVCYDYDKQKPQPLTAALVAILIQPD